MRGRQRLAVLVVVLALAGCGGLASDSPDPTDRTLTPAPVPTAAESFPPGVSAGGVSAEALVAAHRNRLLATNYTLTVRERVFDGNGTVSRSTRRHRVEAGRETYIGRYNRTLFRFGFRRPVDRIAYWAGPDGFATRFTGGDGASALSWSNNTTRALDVDGSGQLARTLSALSLTVTERRTDAVVLVATGTTDGGSFPGPAYVTGEENVSATVRVRSDGVVTDWRFAYDARIQNRTVRVVHRGAVTDVGTTTVPRPEWVDAVKGSAEGTNGSRRVGQARSSMRSTTPSANAVVPTRSALSRLRSMS